MVVYPSNSLVSCLFRSLDILYCCLKQISRGSVVDALKRHVSHAGHTAAACLSLHLKLALLYGLPWSTIAPLQRVQNRSGPLGLSPRDHVSSALQTLHWYWLPIYYRIQFKIALSCTMHSLAVVRSTSTTSWHLLPVTPVGSNYDLRPDTTSLFPVAEQSLAVVPSQ